MNDEVQGVDGQNVDPRETRFQRLLDERISALRFTSAARLVMEAVRVGLAPRDESLLDWTNARVGPESLKRIIDQGFGQLNSPCCHSGFEKCTACDGTGVSGREGCLSCATLGRVRCPFCNGSSLVPFSDIPAAFREPAMHARVELAATHAERLLSEPIADLSSEISVVTELRLDALNCEKLLGLFENAVIEVQKRAGDKGDMELATRLGVLSSKCRQRQLGVLRRLAECWTAIAATGDKGAALAEARATTLEEICLTASLRLTKLAHPFLFQEDAEPEPLPAVTVKPLPVDEETPVSETPGEHSDLAGEGTETK